MRTRRLILPLLFLFIILISAFLVLRARGGEETGPAFALCPGPDQYGYRCEPGAAFTYIDADNDTFLYEDDGTVVVDLPFPFTFYGSSYQQVALSSNGNMQFTTENPAFTNECLNQGPAAGMGELIAPYWDDLDLTLIGFLETAVTGTAGSRIFVIEWDDIPAFGTLDDRVTFEVQLFEENNDIVFLYQDVTRGQGNNGRTATIGLQSELRGNTLQYGCNQLSLTNGLIVHFPHPANAAQETNHQPLLAGQDSNITIPKGDMNILLERLNQEGINALQAMQAYWLGQKPHKEGQTLQADITGNGQEELILLLRPPVAFAHHTQLTIFGQTDGEWQLLLHSYPLARQQDDRHYSLNGVTDKTADGILDILIEDLSSGDVYILTAVSDTNNGLSPAAESQNAAESITFELISPPIP